MYDISVTRFVLALCFVMAAALFVGLAIAAWRNHFWRKTTRPVVLAMSALAFALMCEFAKRLLSLLFIDTPRYALFVRSGPVDDAVNLLLLIGMGAVFYTLAIAYPDVRRGKGEPHERTSHAR
jgi:hypothetical protein